MDKKPSQESQSTEKSSEPRAEVTAKEMDEIIARARQAVKPIINREAANEIVSDDILNFRMKASKNSRE